MDRRPPAHASAFTLMELIVVVTILALLAGILFPAMAAMSRTNRLIAGENAVSTAVIAARAYATRNRQGLFIDIGSTGRTGRYDGAAMIFTPANEMRLVENVPYARDGGSLTDPDPLRFLELKPSPLSGYADIETGDPPARLEYVRLPEHVAVVGIARGGSGTPLLKLLPPPFAVRFDKDGQLISRAGEPVYYDGNYDDKHVLGSDRANPSFTSGAEYDPAEWNPQTDAYASVAEDTTAPATSNKPGLHAKAYDSRPRLPFEAIETVIGVIIYDAREFSAVRPSYESPPGDADVDWLLTNGKPLLFGRHSGRLLRETSRP